MPRATSMSLRARFFCLFSWVSCLPLFLTPSILHRYISLSHAHKLPFAVCRLPLRCGDAERCCYANAVILTGVAESFLASRVAGDPELSQVKSARRRQDYPEDAQLNLLACCSFASRFSRLSARQISFKVPAQIRRTSVLTVIPDCVSVTPPN